MPPAPATPGPPGEPRAIPTRRLPILPRAPAEQDLPSVARDGGASRLPAELRALLARERLSALRVEEVTAIGRPDGPRRSYRVELADGRLVKARTHRDPEVAARMARWLPQLAGRGFPALLATSGAASLEEWVVGEPAPREDEATAEQAGALLGACHALLPAELLGAEDPRLARWHDDCARWIEELRAGGHFADAQARRVGERLRDARPRAASFGLYHGDFAPENLVVGARGLCCVDNTTLGPHLLEVDPGFTVNRWPLDAPLRERFLRGYRRHADPRLFLESEPFWRIAAALRSAAYRLRERTGGVDLPLREIDRLVG